MINNSPVAKYHLIELTLAARIREGAYDEAGLPGERQLADEFGAARVTIRSALSRLEAQGLVARTHRRGTVAISGRAQRQPRRLLRDDIDKFLDRGRDDKRKVLRFGWVSATPYVADALGVPAGTQVLRVARLRSSGAQSLTYTEAYVTRALAPAVTRDALERKPFVRLLEEHGIHIASADQAISCEVASPAAAAALKTAINAPTLKLTRVIHDDAGKPLQLLLGWYRADRFEIRMRMSRAEDATRVWVESR
jgi:GntR family transcriptional regulator